MDHHYTSHSSQPMSYTTSVYQTGAPAGYHAGTSSGLHYTSTVDHGHLGTNPLSYSYTQEVRGSHESPHKSAAPTSYTNYTTGAPTSYTNQAPGGYTAGLSGSYTNFTTSNIGAATPQGYTVTSTSAQPQSYTSGAHATTSYSQAPASYTTTTYSPAANIDHGVNISHHTTGESVKRQVQSLPAPGQPRQSVLSPYRHSMYPEFELVEDLPDRSNLLNSINTLLQKSPARESLLTPPSEVIIKRDSILSPAEINVQRLLKEKYEDGSIYEGEARGGKPHGRGRIIFRDGRIFEGEFKDGKAQGRGVYYYKNGQVCYEGEIYDFLFEGTGVLKCETPNPLQGPFDAQNFGNLGNCWSKYEGEFKGGKKHGKGTLYLTNGEKFTGEFKNDRVDGKGTFESRDGRALQGEWDNNVLKRH